MLIHPNPYSSSAKAKITGESSRLQENVPFMVMDESYNVTYFGLSVEFSVLKWSVRPRVRTLQLFLYKCSENIHTETTYRVGLKH